MHKIVLCQSPFSNPRYLRSHAQAQHVRLDHRPCAVDRAWAAFHRHVPAVPAFDRERSFGEREPDAAHPFGLPVRLRGRAIFLRADLGPGRAQAGAAHRPRAVHAGKSRLRPRARYRKPDRPAFLSGARCIGPRRAGARHRTGSLRGLTGRAGIVAHGVDHGRGAGDRAGDRQPFDAVRGMARDVLPRPRVRRGAYRDGGVPARRKPASENAERGLVRVDPAGILAASSNIRAIGST